MVVEAGGCRMKRKLVGKIKKLFEAIPDLFMSGTNLHIDYSLVWLFFSFCFGFVDKNQNKVPNIV